MFPRNKLSIVFCSDAAKRGAAAGRGTGEQGAGSREQGETPPPHLLAKAFVGKFICIFKLICVLNSGV